MGQNSQFEHSKSFAHMMTIVIIDIIHDIFVVIFKTKSLELHFWQVDENTTSVIQMQALILKIIAKPMQMAVWLVGLRH